MLGKVKDALNTQLANWSQDPERGYTFLKEYIEELTALATSNSAKIPVTAQPQSDPLRPVKEALDSLHRINHDVQLPVLKDTVEVLLERLADYYDGIGRVQRSHALMASLYNELIGVFNSFHVQLQKLSDTVSQIEQAAEQSFSAKVATMTDTTQERVLIDKSLIGRKEVERFLDCLLAPVWEKGDWKAVAPVLSGQTKALISSGLAPKLLNIQLDSASDADAKAGKIQSEMKKFVHDVLFSRLFPKDPQTQLTKEPSYTTSDGRSLLLDFSQDNLLSLMVAHSSPLWFVQTHQIGSASSPIEFVGLNGSKIPERVMADLQEQLPNFRTTDILMSDDEARVVVKQYDPLYSLASMVSIVNYENYYKNTDRRLNPMHTDIKFVREPNPFLQWLSYKAPERVGATSTCPRGHDITAALADGSQYCPNCSKEGIKTLIVKGKMLCPKCQRIIDDGSRKCPECAAILAASDNEKPREKTGPIPGNGKEDKLCPGCITLGHAHPEVMVVPKGTEGKSFCPCCGSAWANLCPYCGAALEKLTVCTKGSDRCIFENPPIVLCRCCNCPVTPDTTRCPRCFNELQECQLCKKEGKERRMVPKGTPCPEKHSSAEPVPATLVSS